MNWPNIDFVKCDKTENKIMVVELEPHWSSPVSQEFYDVKLPSHYPNLDGIIFSKEGIDFNAPTFYFKKQCFVKTLYFDLETLFTANTISFDLPSNEDILLHYQSDVILVSPIEHKEFRILYNSWSPINTFQRFIGSILGLYLRNNDIKIIPNALLSSEVAAIIELQAEILSNFSEEEIKAMDMETSPLYFPIAMECARNYFNAFIWLIKYASNKETLNRMLTDEMSARELSGEAKAVIIKRMAELEDERSFEL